MISRNNGNKANIFCFLFGCLLLFSYLCRRVKTLQKRGFRNTLKTNGEISQVLHRAVHLNASGGIINYIGRCN